MTLDVLAQVIVLGLALSVPARLLSRERGPYGVFERLRGLHTQTFDNVGAPVPPKGLREEIGSMLGCWVCNAPWIALAGLGLWILPVDIRNAIVGFFAVVGVSYLVNTKAGT